MTKIEEIQTAIERLSAGDIARLREWFLERDWQQWDAQIEADSESGKLDFLIAEALNEKAANTLAEL